jgi:outer membrane protein OmpA-like peptidoglycan-associated protein
VTDAVDADPGSAAAGARPAAATEDLDRLRRLILAAEQDRLAEIERRLDDPGVRTEELSVLLPDALARAAHDGNRLGKALSGVVDDALDASIKRSRTRLAQVLAPAMGPAIRRAITEALRAMVDSFNQVLQHSFSLRALRWRVEAWRTGRPFAEVVLSHSLVFRVEQIFLVHRESGLLLQHVAADGASAQDGDLVSGMLTAIQDFVRDSFSVGADEAVDTMRVGNLTVWVEQGGRAYVAAVIRGTPPIALRGVLRDALETIHLEFAEALEAFSGDSAPFEDARHHLEGCLQMQVASDRERRHWLAPAVAGGVGLFVVAVWLALSWRAARRWDAYITRLAQEPGILVVSEHGGMRRSSVAGLADPYAADPVKLLAGFGLDPDRVSCRWKPYVSQEPSIVLARARAVLQPPGTVTLGLSNETLSAKGSAPHRWITAASARAATVPGVLKFDANHIVDEDLAAMGPARDRLEAVVLRFDVGSAELPRRELAMFDRAAAALQEIAAVAREKGIAVRIDVVGHTDGTGPEAANVWLSRARAEGVVSRLEARGVRAFTFAIQGIGASQPLRSEVSADSQSYNRSVTFRVAAQP